MAIDVNNLKFNKNDLKFFKKQLAHQTPVFTAKEKLITEKIINILNGEYPTTSTTIVHMLSLNGIAISRQELRKLIALIRRYPELDSNNQKYKWNRFITATNDGYKFSYIHDEKSRKEIISYFQKTQTRWKLTFAELYNLMELLNKFPKAKKE